MNLLRPIFFSDARFLCIKIYFTYSRDVRVSLWIENTKETKEIVIILLKERWERPTPVSDSRNTIHGINRPLAPFFLSSSPSPINLWPIYIPTFFFFWHVYANGLAHCLFIDQAPPRLKNIYKKIPLMVKESISMPMRPTSGAATSRTSEANWSRSR